MFNFQPEVDTKGEVPEFEDLDLCTVQPLQTYHNLESASFDLILHSPEGRETSGVTKVLVHRRRKGDNPIDWKTHRSFLYTALCCFLEVWNVTYDDVNTKGRLNGKHTNADNRLSYKSETQSPCSAWPELLSHFSGAANPFGT